MEILAIQLMSGVAPNQSAAFVQRSTPEWPGCRTGSLSLKLLRTAIPALRDGQHVIVTPEYCPDVARDDITEFCEVFYHLNRGQWFVWPSAVGQIS